MLIYIPPTSYMPSRFLVPNTTPRITLVIFEPLDQTGVMPLSFTGAILDAHQYLLEYAILHRGNRPIPKSGLGFSVGSMSIYAQSASPDAGRELDCRLLGLILNAIWALIGANGYKTWEFEVIRGEPTSQEVKIGHLNIRYKARIIQAAGMAENGTSTS